MMDVMDGWPHYLGRDGLGTCEYNHVHGQIKAGSGLGWWEIDGLTG